jgi:hypothetical protein
VNRCSAPRRAYQQLVQRSRVNWQCHSKKSLLALTLLANERQTPGKCIHEVGQPIWVRRAIKLPNVQHVRFIFEDRRLVVVHVQVIWSGEECHHGWETSRASFPVHTVPVSTLSHDLNNSEKKHWYPASCASCARMMDNNRLRSRNEQAAW